MANAFTIRIFVPDGDPDGLRIIDRQSSPSRFFVFPRDKIFAHRFFTLFEEVYILFSIF